jgi:hypothetical protein
MSLDYRSENLYPIVKTFTATQTATEVQIPKTCLKVTIGCEQHEIYWSQVGEDGQLLGANKAFIDGGAYMQVTLGRGKNRSSSIYIATKSSSSALVTLIFEEG